jgi:glycerol-3-phosphate dehydrogenase
VVVPNNRFPIKQAIYFDVDDGRMIFAIPRERTTYIGTTDTTYQGSKEEVLTTQEDAAYIINATNRTFPNLELTINDIESSWAGLRPLIHEDGKSASELSRKDEIFVSETGLISIAGGKLTGYRKMAERIVDQVVSTSFPQIKVKCFTDSIPFSGAQFKNYDEVKNYKASLLIQLSVLNLAGHVNYLVANYGKQCDTILDRLRANLEKDTDIALVKAELWHCLEYEMVLTPEDFLVRRTGMLYFDLPRLQKVKEVVFLEFQSFFNWSSNDLGIARERLEKLILQSTQFSPSNKP